MTLPYIEPCACCQVLSWYPLSVHSPGPSPQRPPTSLERSHSTGLQLRLRVVGCTTGTAQAQILVFHVLSCLVLTCLVLTCLFLSSSARISSTFQSLGWFITTSDPSFPGFSLLFQLFPLFFSTALLDSLSFPIPPTLPLSVCCLKQAGVSSSS